MQRSLLKGFYLHDLLIEPTSGTVSGPDGDQHLKPKAIEILLYLAERPFELVERQALLEAVWGEDQGSQEALSHAISELRSGLGDHVDDPQLIQTVPTRGYRLLRKPRLIDGPDAASTPEVADEHGFIGSLMRRGVVQAGLAYLIFSWLLIQVADAVTPILGLAAWFPSLITYSAIGGMPLVLILAWLLEQSDGRLYLDRGNQSGRMLSGLERNYLSIIVAYIIAVIGASAYQVAVGFDVPAANGVVVAEEDTLLPVRPNSIAVLKFLNINNDDTARAFSDGLGEDILDRLARIPGLSVSSRGDSWSLPDNASSDIVRKRLRVAYFLEGSVRVIGDELKVVVQLIESATGFHVFSRSFETRLTNHMEVQREITELAVANLRVAMPDSGNSVTMMDVSEHDVDAYILYRRGKAILDEPQNIERIDEAVKLFEKALVLDPEYAAAHAGICGAEIARFYETRVPDALKRAEYACSAALSTNRNLGVVYSKLGHLYIMSDRYGDAFNAYSQALRINARDVVAMRGIAEIMQRRNEVDDAERVLKEAIELQPGNWRSINTLGAMYFNTGRYSDAADAFRKVVFLDPDNWESLGNLGSVLMMTGNYEAAVDALNRSLSIEKDEYFLSNLGVVHYYLGEYDRAAGIYRQAIEEVPRDVSAWLNLGDALRFTSRAGDADAAYRRAAELAADEIAIAPNSSAYLYRQAWAVAGIGDLETANSLIERSLRLAPDSIYGLYYDGLIKHARGEIDAAIASLGRAVELGYPVAMLATDPLLRSLRGTREFKALVKSVAE